MNATINLENKHFPVLLNELISIISPLYGGTFIDCTFGQGGYSEKILENKQNSIIALDRDKDVLSNTYKFQKKYDKRFKFYNLKFSQLDQIKLKNHKIKGIIFDLGYSLNQIKNSQKGLSFSDKGKLNMKMGINDFSADDVISKMDENNSSPSNGLENFDFDEETPELFNSDASINETEDETSLSTETSTTREEEDDLEIPAFLRRQKN